MNQVIRALSDAVGWSETIYIIRKWGGRELRVPKNVIHSDPLALVLGYAVAKRLVEYFGGEKLQLPSERNALLEARNAAIVAQAAAGESQESIGLAYGLTRQAVGHILKAARTAPQKVAVSPHQVVREQSGPAAKERRAP